MSFVNYHRHSMFSNIILPDSPATNEQYAKRAVELGHTVLSSVEHGWCGNYMQVYDLCGKYNLKPLFGAETYFVKDRTVKDATNVHIVLLAKNETGRKAINRIISEANLTGFYYRARIDFPLLLSLPKEDVWITTACIGGIWKYSDYEDILMQFKEHFGSNLFLEVQNHNTQKQAELNQRIVDLSNKHNIKIIFGCDSHFISPEQSTERDNFLLSKKMEYEDEDHWYMDYPSDDEAYDRFISQGVLTKAQIREAIDNTNIFESVEPYDSIIFKKEIKMPTIYPDKSQEEKDKIFCDLIWSEWDKEKTKIPAEKWEHYRQEIEKEIGIVIITRHADYFLLNHAIIKEGKRLGGVITNTGRGSGVSFYINKLLGFTKVDRISAKVKMYPERFMSPTRILETKSLADFDMNLANPEVFAQAQKNVLGQDSSYPMIAFGTMKPKAAWKMYARAKNIDFETANLVSSQIDDYELDLKHKTEEDDEISPEDYILEEFKQDYLESTKYQGIIADVKPAPCGFLLFSGNIKEEIGLIKIKENICCVFDGLIAETYKFLKNDLLKVSVVDLVSKVYQRIGIPDHEIDELLSICDKTPKVWNIYKTMATMGINQVEQQGTNARVSKYAPKNISELSAFVAAIRPGFKSMYRKFEAREDFSYGIESFDKLIRTEELPQSFMLYQEQAMTAFEYSGIPLSEAYEVIKNIAKKRVEKVLKYKDIFIPGFTKKIMEEENKPEEEANEIAHKTWQIIEDSSRYSFNACVSGDTRICRTSSGGKYTPTIEEMYLIKNKKEYAKQTNHFDLHKKYQRGYGYALSMFEDGRIRKNKIINIYQSGIRDTFKVTTSTGANIVCTSNHKFPTPEGDRKLSELNIGNLLFIKDIPSRTDAIISIEYIGKQSVYDIEMQAPAHNFISESGLVTSNSHSYCVALDSLYGAYLKATYPIQFYEVFLNMLEKDGDKDRLILAKTEAREHFKITFPQYKFRQDNRAIIGVPEKNMITSSLSSIKGFGDEIGRTLYELGLREYKNFVDFLAHAEDHGMMSSKFRDLIIINYFSEFGENQRLLSIFDETRTGKLKYTRTLLEKTKKQRYEGLVKLYETLPDKKLDLDEQINEEYRILGYIQSTYPQLKKNYVYVTRIVEGKNYEGNKRGSTVIDIYCLNNGVTASLKISDNVFTENNIMAGDIIKCEVFEKKEARRKVDGKWTSLGYYEDWLSKYYILNQEETKKLLL